MDAWHLSLARLVLPDLVVPDLVENGEQLAFAAHDERQAEVAQELGFVCVLNVA